MNSNFDSTDQKDSYREYPNLIEMYVPVTTSQELVDEKPRVIRKRGMVIEGKKEKINFKLEPNQLFTLMVVDLDQIEMPRLLRGGNVGCRSSPWKEVKYDRGASDSIGNCYSSTARDLKMSDLAPIRFKREEYKAMRVEVDSPPLSPITRRRRTINVAPRIPIVESALDPIEFKGRMINKQISGYQRYCFYLERGFEDGEVLELDIISWKKMRDSIKKEMGKELTWKELEREVKGDYKIAMKKSVMEYILKDEEEQQRLMILIDFERFILAVSRSPVPWPAIQKSRNWLTLNLHITDPIMSGINKIFSKFQHTKIVDLSVLTDKVIPMTREVVYY